MRCPSTPSVPRAAAETPAASPISPPRLPPLRPGGPYHCPSRPTRCGSSVLDGHSLFAVVIPARRANAVGLFHIPAARAGLQRGAHRLVVGAARALLALRGSALGYGHSDRP